MFETGLGASVGTAVGTSVRSATESGVRSAASTASSGSGTPSFDVVFVEFTAAVDRLDESGVAVDAAAIAGMRRGLDRLNALVSAAEVRFDQYELWRDRGAGSMRGWLADECGLPRRRASKVARRCERLEQWPEVAEAWARGDVSGEQVDVLIAAVPQRFVAMFADHSAGVVAAISPLDVVRTGTAMRQWVRMAEAADGPEHFRERASGLHLDATLDGQVVLQGHFNRTEAAIIGAALRDFDEPDPVDEHGDLIGERRTAGQRSADALVAACRFAITHREGAGDGGRFLPHVSLVVDVAELRAAALRGAGISTASDLDRVAGSNSWTAAERAWFTEALDHHGDAVTFDGTELDAPGVSMLSCDSVVQRVLMQGSKVLNLGREVRTATSAQRRVIITRDRHCRAPGCRTGPKFCDVHHVDHWALGGRTDVDRMVLLCGTHHRLFHRPGWRMELDDQATLTVHSPKGWSCSTVPELAERLILGRTNEGFG
jgi:hypothetical protein